MSDDGLPTGIDPDDLAALRRILDQAAELGPTHPDSIAVQRAVGGMFKDFKRSRKKAARRTRIDADRAVINATATGSADRIDDETAGILLSGDGDSVVGHLIRPQGCYICKESYTEINAFHHQLCPKCVASNSARRRQRTDLTGKTALLTGGRAKIGMYVALMLLRDGADLTITTRFPHDAARRFSSQDDADQWMHRLRIVGIDLRDPAQVVALADEVAARGPLDILINNAAQTVRRSPGSYRSLIDAESTALTGAAASIALDRTGYSLDAHPKSITGGDILTASPSAAMELATSALRGGSASPARVANGTAVDAGGLLPDVVSHNSWVATVDHVDPMELLEVQLCNSVAPFILLSRLTPALASSSARRTYVVNVSAMEGIFSRRYKGAGHPHTNMAKAALNMLTRTSADQLFEDGILVTAVDTGWITDERPHTDKMRLAEEGFRAPLDLVDGAARIYHPIVDGENGIDIYGCFLKDFEVYPW